MDKLNQVLRSQAIELGLCNEWQNDWSANWDCNKMADKMYEGIIFCMKHRWPTCNFIKENFTLEFRRSRAILADDKYSLINPAKALIVGNSNSTIRYNGIASGTIYLRDNSNVTIIAKGRAKVFVRSCDNTNITAEAQEMSHIVIIRCSSTVSVKTQGNVIVRKPRLKC